MQTLAEIRALLASRGLTPKRSLGQNFLIDHNLIRKLVDASGVRAGDLVVEIGPGTGTLSEELLDRGVRLVACELDDSLAELLRERFASRPTFSLIHGDCLDGKRELNPHLREIVAANDFALVANLPYGAATPLITTLLLKYPRCASMHITIQREVIDRLAAGPGTKDYGALSVITGSLARVTQIATLPPECFWPRPEVTSGMASIVRLPTPLADDPAAFADFCARAFAQRRKQLGTLLGRAVPWPPGISPSDRAEQLTVPKLIEIWKAVARSQGDQ
jgi:16S rRNA (adenine1518-N6/adenine1519-N6)-dimethyltransferase